MIRRPFSIRAIRSSILSSSVSSRIVPQASLFGQNSASSPGSISNPLRGFANAERCRIAVGNHYRKIHTHSELQAFCVMYLILAILYIIFSYNKAQSEILIAIAVLTHSD